MQLVRSKRYVKPREGLSVSDFVDTIDRRQGQRLRRALIGGDGLALLLSSVAVFWLSSLRASRGEKHALFAAMLFAIAGLWWMRSQGLWLARVSAIRVVEITRTSRAMVITAVTMVTFDRVLHFDMRIRHVVTATLIAWVLLTVWRSAYRTWLTAARLDDRY